MIPKIDVKLLVSGACFATAVLLLVVISFDDRGRHFSSEASGKADRSGTYALSKARMLNKVIGHVRTNYVDMTRVQPREMLVAGLRSVQDSVPEVMLDVSEDKRGRPTQIVVKVDDQAKTFDLARVTDLYTLTWKLMDVFDFLERHLPANVDLEDLEYSTVNGMLETLDPHSVLLTPRVYRDMQVGTQGKFGGLGIVISQKDGIITVMSVMEGTPAKRAGLKSGDMVMQIGAESTVNMPLADAVNRMRGEAGSGVVLWIKRKGWAAPKSFKIIREEIRVRSVKHHDLGEGIGHISIRTFQGNTFDDLQEALEKLSRKPGGLKGLVLDLRENPGGLLEQAISVSDRFLSQGTVVSTVRGGAKGQEREPRHATQRGTLSDVPLVVLINRGSASASEIVAGALKNNNRALIVGTTSFGKGSVQVIYKLGEAALKLTVAQYLTPGEISIQGTGIVPDIEIVGLRADEANSLDLHSDLADVYGEATLKKSLSNKNTRAERPSIRLEMLRREDPKSKGDEWKPDALITMARDLIKSAPATDRKQALLQAHGFIKTRQGLEEVALAKKLQKLGIDWSAGPAASKRAKLDLSLTVSNADGTPVTGMVKAGSTLKLTAVATNRSSKALYRVLGVVHSAIGSLNDLELVFGKMAPGQSATFTAEVAIGRSSWTIGDVLKVKLFSAKDEVTSVDAATVQVEAKPRPRFAYRMQVDDKRGSGDGLIQRGESVDLVVDITNVGDGASAKTLASIKNESGEDVFIKTGRQQLGALGVGETARARFEVKIKRSLKPRLINLRLSVIDQRLRTWSNDDLSVKVFPGELPKAEKMTGLATVPASGGSVPIVAGAHVDMPVVATMAAGGKLKVLAKAGEWLKVQWSTPGVAPGAKSEANVGWVSSKRVSVANGPDGIAQGVATPSVHHAPPRLVLAGIGANSKTSPLVTNSAAWTLSGSALFGAGSHSGRRYVYVFRGPDKVFFKSAAPEGPKDVVDFSATVNLKEGSNSLTIVAREGDGDVTVRKVIVYRKK